jgi:hypothetical protein
MSAVEARADESRAGFGYQRPHGPVANFNKLLIAACENAGSLALLNGQIPQASPSRFCTRITVAACHNRRVSNGDQVQRVAGMAMKRSKSVDFTGYWQRHIAE